VPRLVVLKPLHLFFWSYLGFTSGPTPWATPTALLFDIFYLWVWVPLTLFLGWLWTTNHQIAPPYWHEPPAPSSWITDSHRVVGTGLDQWHRSELQAHFLWALKKESFRDLRWLARWNRHHDVETEGQRHIIQSLLWDSQPRWEPALPPVGGCAGNTDSLSLNSWSTRCWVKTFCCFQYWICDKELHRIIEKIKIHLTFSWLSLHKFLMQAIAEYFTCSTE
jgi:hypothetical protein